MLGCLPVVVVSVAYRLYSATRYVSRDDGLGLSLSLNRVYSPLSATPVFTVSVLAVAGIWKVPV